MTNVRGRFPAARLIFLPAVTHRVRLRRYRTAPASTRPGDQPCRLPSPRPACLPFRTPPQNRSHVYASPLPQPPPLPARRGKHRLAPSGPRGVRVVAQWCHLRDRDAVASPNPALVRPPILSRQGRNRRKPSASGAESGTAEPRCHLRHYPPQRNGRCIPVPLHRASSAGAACGAVCRPGARSGGPRSRSCQVRATSSECEFCGSGAGLGCGAEAPPTTLSAVAERPLHTKDVSPRLPAGVRALSPVPTGKTVTVCYSRRGERLGSCVPLASIETFI